jgi:hypothetical protein
LEHHTAVAVGQLAEHQEIMVWQIPEAAAAGLGITAALLQVVLVDLD